MQVHARMMLYRPSGSDRLVEPGWSLARGESHGHQEPRKAVAELPRFHPHIDATSPEVRITRWRQEDTPVAFGPSRHDDDAILVIAVSATDATIRVDDVVVHDGRMSAGTFQLVPPGHSVRTSLRKPADFIRLYIPRGIFAALTEGTPVARMEQRLVARPSHDHVVEQLALSIVNATGGDQSFDRRFLDGVGAALLARAGAILATKHDACSAWAGLIPWRLKRVIDFIERNLDSPVSLSDMARSAGLSRMHFAAQFRLATGFRPHAYLTRRRIERARELLRHTEMPLVDVAFSVGFQTQAHFTTIFRQLSGEPPGQWRNREAATAERAAAVSM